MKSSFSFFTTRTTPSLQKGFTLIEMLVSVAIFAVVMVIALGALLSMSESNRKAETLKSVMNNLNFAVDSMSRSIRTGTNYHCGTGGTVTAPLDCASSGDTYFAFLPAVGQTTMYRFENVDGTACGQVGTIGCVMRSNDAGATFLPITSPEVIVTRLQFYVLGAPTGDGKQPKTIILLDGYVQVNGKARTVSECGTSGVTCSIFNLQTSVTQRLYDQ